MTSVIGFDVGNLQSVIGLARNRGIDIITNETSNRATPSLVSFGFKNRAIGEAAKTQETSNYKNTVGSLKRLIGRSFADRDVQEYESKFVNAKLVDVNGALGVTVTYLGQERTFTATQLYAMLLGKLRDIAHAESKAPVNNVVIAVPGWYTDVQRRAVLDAAEIAGLNALKLINEGTATAFGYGITKNDLPAAEEKPRVVAFVDIGHSDYSVTIASFTRSGVTIKGEAYDRHFGGRDFDYALVQHFAAEFQQKYKIDVMSNKKAIFRLQTAVERLKKILSANLQAPLNVESIMEDIDASGMLTREAFEGLVEPLLARTEVPLEAALAQSGYAKEDIDFIELVGGSTRVPALKQRIQDFFGRPLSTTTNQDEAVARGATLACATLSPVFRVRDFAVADISSYPIEVTWEKVPEDDDTSLRVFDSKATFPSSKNLTLQRSQPFSLEARYAEPDHLPGSLNPWIARVDVKNIVPTSDGSPATVKLRIRLNHNGIFNFESAVVHEVTDQDETSDAPKEDEMQTDGEAKPKKVVKKEVPIVVGTSSLDKAILDDYQGQEGEMHAGDKLLAETEDRKNALEEYIYDMRDKLDGSLSAFATSSEKAELQKLLSAAEEWLYSEEGEEATKSLYVSKLDSLKALGDPISLRYKEHNDRPAVLRRMRESIGEFQDKLAAAEERYSHIPPDQLQQVVERLALEQKWLEDQSARQAERPKSEKPAFLTSEVLKRSEELTYFCNGILNKPKPASKSVPTPTPSADNAKDGDENAKEAETPEATNMDVD